MVNLSDKYWKRYVNVSADPAWIAEENKRLAKQSHCKHEITTTFRKFEKFSTKCEQCKLVIESDSTGQPEIKSNEQFL